MDNILKCPFPYFGGKSKVAGIVWDRFGDVVNYVEPFAGSLAVLLGRRTTPGIETVNDKCCYLSNFWRAIQSDPDGVAMYADWPVNEADLTARHLWLVSNPEFQERMKTDPHYYDVKVAGWWVYGISSWIGSGWCSRQLPHLGNAGKGVNRQLPHLGDAGTGVHRKLPHLGNAGKGVNRQLPHLGDAGTGVHRKRPHLGDAGKGSLECGLSDLTSATRERSALFAYMRELAERLRRVRVCCGDWSRILGPSPTVKLGIAGVFLDPPYADTAERTNNLYATDSNQVAHDVRRWALEHGDDPLMRIALCGYDGEHDIPRRWEAIPWKARGGYGSQGDNAARQNSAREMIWFSPHCLRPQENLFYALQFEDSLADAD